MPLESPPDTFLVSTDSIIEGYRHLEAAPLAGQLADVDCSDRFPDVVCADGDYPGNERRGRMAVVVGWGLVALICMGVGFLFGMCARDMQRKPIDAEHKAALATQDAAMTKQKAVAMGEYLQLLSRAQIAVEARDAALESARQEIRRLHAVAKWLEGKLQTSL